jgi:hypothetical protein
MATPSRPSTASARLRNKTSELSDLFRGRQHSSLPSSSTDPSPKAKRKIPLFSLRKKSPAAPEARRSPTPPIPTPSSSTNTCVAPPHVHVSLSKPFIYVFFQIYRLARHPWSLGIVKHSLRNSQSQGPLFRPYPGSTTRLHLNVPQLHQQTREVHGPSRAPPRTRQAP